MILILILIVIVIVIVILIDEGEFHAHTRIGMWEVSGPINTAAHWVGSFKPIEWVKKNRINT